MLVGDDRAEITARIINISPDTVRRWGRMSAHQMICHLTDAFATCLGDRPAEDKSTLFTRTILRFVGVTVPMPRPKGVPTMPEVNQEKGGTPPAEFDADLRRLRTTIEEFEKRLNPDTMRHPVLDAFTDAGSGVGFFLPFDDTRYFFPWRPLETSPISPVAFFRGRALTILANEVLWVWLPVGLLWVALRSRRG